MSYIDELNRMNACQPALDWLAKGGFPTLDAAWQVCKRGDWMLWLVGELTDRNDEAQLRKLTLAKARCAGLVKHLMKDERSVRAVEVAERFGLGEATRKELDNAASATFAAAASASAAFAAAASATRATAYAAFAVAFAAAYATRAAAYAAFAAAFATRAFAAANATANADVLEQCADAVRTVYAHAPELEVTA